MVAIAYTKAVAVGNDFLIVERDALVSAGIGNDQLPSLARSMCDRDAGIGADGLEVVGKSTAADAEIQLWNADGSAAEISGNGTRCVAAYLVASGRAESPVTISTDAGIRSLELLSVDDGDYRFRMDMGKPTCSGEPVPLRLAAAGKDVQVVLADVGNPQCVVFVEGFDFDWHSLGRAIETQPQFQRGTNVSFVRVIDRRTIEARFWERGAGATQSSGTGAAGAAAAAIASGRTESPMKVRTPGGDMSVEWTDSLCLIGSARLIASGHYHPD